MRLKSGITCQSLFHYTFLSVPATSFKLLPPNSPFRNLLRLLVSFLSISNVSNHPSLIFKIYIHLIPAITHFPSPYLPCPTALIFTPEEPIALILFPTFHASQPSSPRRPTSILVDNQVKSRGY